MSESSLWPPARMKTKWSRERIEHPREHGMFHRNTVKVLQKSPGHGDPVTLERTSPAPRHGRAHARRGRLAARSWLEDREKGGNAPRTEGRSVLWTSVSFPDVGEHSHGAADAAAACVWLNRSDVSELVS